MFDRRGMEHLRKSDHDDRFWYSICDNAIGNDPFEFRLFRFGLRRFIRFSKFVCDAIGLGHRLPTNFRTCVQHRIQYQLRRRVFGLLG